MAKEDDILCADMLVMHERIYRPSKYTKHLTFIADSAFKPKLKRHVCGGINQYYEMKQTHRLKQEALIAPRSNELS